MVPIKKEELKDRLESRLNVLYGQNTGNKSTTFNDNTGKRIIPPEARPLVAALAMTEGVKKTSEIFGVGKDQIANIRDGKGWDGYQRPERVEEVKKVKEVVSELALEKLQDSLGLITHESLKDLSPKKLVSIGKDISIIVKNVSGEQQNQNIAQVILFAPNQRDEKKYETIDVEAKVV